MTTITRLCAGAMALVLASPAHAVPPTTRPPVTDVTSLGATPSNGIATTVGAALGRIARPLTRIAELTDSKGCFGTYASSGTNAGYVKSVQDVLTWAEAFSGGSLVFDQVNAPPGAAGTIVALKVVPDVAGNPQGGANYTAPTISIPSIAGFAATPTVVGGRITGATVTATGAAPGSSVTSASVTITDSTGSGAVLTPVIGGRGSFCAGGTTLDEMRARLSDIVNQIYGPKPDIILNWGGDNNCASIVSGGSCPISAMLTQAMAIIKTESDAGILPVFMVETGKGNQGLSTYTTAQQNQLRQQMETFNNGLRAMARLDPVLNPTRTQFLLIDGSQYWIDGSATSNGGQPAPYRTTDGKHPTQWTAMTAGRLLEKALRPYYQTAIGFTYSPLLYDATYNKLGSLIPGFSGTDGANSATGITGSVPHGWSLFRASGSGTLSGTSTIINPTATSPNADGTIIPSYNVTFTATNNGAAGDILQLQYAIAPGGTISAGDTIQGSCQVAWSGLQNVNRINLVLTDGTGLLAQYGQSATTYFPPANDTFAGSVPASDAVQPFRLVTAPMTLTAASVTANSLKLYLQIGYDASATPASVAGFGATAGAAANITLRNCQIHKTNTGLIQ